MVSLPFMSKGSENHFILIHDRSVDKVCGETASLARKRDAAVLYVRVIRFADNLQGALTQREARDFREDVYT